MKKKNVITITAIMFVFGIIGACDDSRQKEPEQENTTEVEDVEKIADNKKENEGVENDIISNSDIDNIKAKEKDGADSLTSENETSNNINVSTQNTSSGNNTGNSSATSSNNDTGNNAGKNNSSSSGNNTGNSTNNNSSNSNSTTEQPTHTHTWVHVDATGHYETVTIQAAWDEEIPVYENVAHSVCNQCNADITGNEISHNDTHLLAYESGGWHTEWKYEKIGTEIVHHDAITEQRWVQDSPAYDICSGCGATK